MSTPLESSDAQRHDWLFRPARADSPGILQAADALIVAIALIAIVSARFQRPLSGRSPGNPAS